MLILYLFLIIRNSKHGCINILIQLLSLAQCDTTIDYHYSPDKLIQFLLQTPVIFPKVISPVPIPKAITVFADVSSSDIAAVHTPTQTYSKQTNMTLAQRTELLALIWALELFPQQPVNIYSDSAYLYTVSLVIETAFIGHMAEESLFHLFIQLKSLFKLGKTYASLDI